MVRKPPRVLDVPDQVSHTSNPEGGEYPSWVPKWFEPRTTLPMTGAFLAGFCDGHFRYFAQVHDNPLAGGARFPRTLSLDGFFVDSTHGVSEVMRFETGDREATVAIMERSWLQLFPFPMTPPPGTRYRDGQPLDVAFCKAVSAYPLGDIMGLIIKSWASQTSIALSDVLGSRSSLSEAVKDGGAKVTSFLRQLNQIRPSSTHPGRISSREYRSFPTTAAFL